MTPAGCDPLHGLDRRLTPYSGSVALVALKGKVAAISFTEGRPARVAVPVVDLCDAPAGARDRQLVFGAGVTVIDERAGWAFVQAAADHYCGWVPLTALGQGGDVTHVVCAPATHIYREASIKRGEVMALPIGAGLCAIREEGGFVVTAEGFVPRQHLRAVTSPEADPVAVAERLLGAPYLWGGNGYDGIDCSGLVQLSYGLCGIACPADSDQQWHGFGQVLPEEVPVIRGDLFFWKGHVAMAVDDTCLIHANGHHMAVRYEPIRETMERIAASGEGIYLGRKRRL
ncbi:NlpC/P60 family protein [Thioclava sp. GXIMD4215]|uniref:C40 family peptidase n=1 Tax=Thioclava sp. GXIMD4215 TaxID=3131928 RepID=UPI00324D544E